MKPCGMCDFLVTAVEQVEALTEENRILKARLREAISARPSVPAARRDDSLALTLTFIALVIIWTL